MSYSLLVTTCIFLIILMQKYNRFYLYTTHPYTKRQKCVAKQQYILLKQLYVLYKLVLGKCDVEENDDIAMEFGVRNIPTILFFVYYNYLLFISQLLFL